MNKPWLNDTIIRLAKIINQNHKKYWGESLINENNSPEDISHQLYTAPFVVLAHNHTSDPTFIYANQCAQKLWGYSWQEFIGLPSRLSAGPASRDSRNAFLRDVAKSGYSSNYSGVRVRKDGVHFRIENTKLWNLYNVDKQPIGQAATFNNWHYMK